GPLPSCPIRRAAQRPTPSPAARRSRPRRHGALWPDNRSFRPRSSVLPKQAAGPTTTNEPRGRQESKRMVGCGFARWTSRLAESNDLRELVPPCLSLTLLASLKQACHLEHAARGIFSVKSRRPLRLIS